MENDPRFKNEEDEDEEDQDFPKVAVFVKETPNKDQIQIEKNEHSFLDQLFRADKAPELEEQAILEELNEAEVNDLSKVIAQDRIREIDRSSNSQLLIEDLAAQSYLESVVISGEANEAFLKTIDILDIDKKHQQDVQSLITQSSFSDSYTQSKKYAPKLQDKGNFSKQSNPSIYPRESIDNPSTTVTNKDQKPNSKSKSLTLSTLLVESLFQRREPRLKNKSIDHQLKERLNQRVFKLTENILTNEQKIRQLSKDMNVVKKAEMPIIYQKLKTEHLAQKEIEKSKKVSLESVPEDKIDTKKKIIQKLGTKEILNVASKIEIDKISIKKLYLKRLISEKGLRRIVEAYFRGMDIKAVLKKELIQKEIDFERDPLLRDRGVDLGDYRPEKINIDKLIKIKGISWDDQKVVKTSSSSIPKQESRTSPRTTKGAVPKLIDFIVISLLLILSVIVLLILIEKG